MPKVTIDLESLGLSLTSGVQYRFDLDEDFIHDTTYKLPNVSQDNFALVEASVPKIHNITFGTGENIVLDVGVSNVLESTYFVDDYIETDYFEEGAAGTIYLYDESSTLVQSYLVPDDVLISDDKSKIILPASGLLSNGFTYQIYFEANILSNLLGNNIAQEIDFTYAYPGTGTSLSANISSNFDTDTFLSVIYSSRNYTFDLTGSQNHQYFGTNIAMNNEYIVAIENADYSIRSSDLMYVYSFDGSTNTLVDTIEVETSGQATTSALHVINGNASADAYILSDRYLYSVKDNQIKMIQYFSNAYNVGCSQTGIFAYVEFDDYDTLHVYRNINESGLSGTVEKITLPETVGSNGLPNIFVSNAFIVVTDGTASAIQSKIYVYDTTTLDLVNNITTEKTYFNTNTTAINGCNLYFRDGDIVYINLLTGTKNTLLEENPYELKANDNLIAVSHRISNNTWLKVYRADNTQIVNTFLGGLNIDSNVAISETGYCFSLPKDNTNTGKITYNSF